ncbi:MAG: hypothetical protein ACPGUD_10370 [Parashewanella sp.]
MAVNRTHPLTSELNKLIKKSINNERDALSDVVFTSRSGKKYSLEIHCNSCHSSLRLSSFLQHERVNKYDCKNLYRQHSQLDPSSLTAVFILEQIKHKFIVSNLGLTLKKQTIQHDFFDGLSLRADCRQCKQTVPFQALDKHQCLTEHLDTSLIRSVSKAEYFNFVSQFREPHQESSSHVLNQLPEPQAPKTMTKIPPVAPQTQPKILDAQPIASKFQPSVLKCQSEKKGDCNEVTITTSTQQNRHHHLAELMLQSKVNPEKSHPLPIELTDMRAPLQVETTESKLTSTANEKWQVTSLRPLTSPDATQPISIPASKQQDSHSEYHSPNTPWYQAQCQFLKLLAHESQLPRRRSGALSMLAVPQSV